MMNYIAIFFLGFFIGLLLAFIAWSDLYISWGEKLTEAQERALHRLGFKV